MMMMTKLKMLILGILCIQSQLLYAADLSEIPYTVTVNTTTGVERGQFANVKVLMDTTTVEGKKKVTEFLDRHKDGLDSVHAVNKLRSDLDIKRKIQKLLREQKTQKEFRFKVDVFMSSDAKKFVQQQINASFISDNPKFAYTITDANKAFLAKVGRDTKYCTFTQNSSYCICKNSNWGVNHIPGGFENGYYIEEAKAVLIDAIDSFLANENNCRKVSQELKELEDKRSKNQKEAQSSLEKASQ